nr:tyrosine-type recombinase/integrase [Methylobacterium variabile]
MSEGKRRQAIAAAALEAFWAALRNDRPTRLTNRQVVALAGDVYRAWAEGEGRERVTAVQLTASGAWVPVTETAEEEAAGFGAALRRLIEKTDAGDLEPTLGPIVSRLLTARGIASVDPDTWEALLEAFALALQDAFAARQRNAEGDFRPDPQAERFPRWEEPKAVQAAVSLLGLVDGWWAERKAVGGSEATHARVRIVMTILGGFLEHDDATRVTTADIVRFKDHRLKTAKPQTVKASDLPALRGVFGWAAENGHLPTNPAKGVTLRLGKTQRVRPKGFTDEEAAAILQAARAVIVTKRIGADTAAIRRWIPWLSAYTGARVGELTQLRKQDLWREGEHWVLRITPEAGTVKNKEARDVPLHPALLEEGFVGFVQAAKAGPLFYRPKEGVSFLKAQQTLRNQVSGFVRETVSDPRVLPTHGWRHRFKTVGISAGIGDRVLDAIQGHAPRTAGDGYGEVTVRAMVDAMAKFPRVDVR